jgi:gluconate 2-dehydrogenase gamma chain
MIMSRQNRVKRDYNITALAEEMRSSGMDRRSFLLRMAMAGVAASLPLKACMPGKKDSLLLERNPQVLSEKEWSILLAVQEHLFPSESDSPGASDINAAAYVQWILTDKEMDPREQQFLKSGLTKVDDEAKERWEKPFLEMLPENQVKLLQHIESHDWGDSWISVMLLYIFEALLSDPIYGVNVDEKGWKWLGYTAGQPRPDNKYSEIVKQFNSKYS